MKNYDEIVQGFSNALISWYPFRKGANILLALDSSGQYIALEEVIRQKGYAVDSIVSPYSGKLNRKYDYIVCIGALEETRDPADFLSYLHAHLLEAGRLILCTDNRIGIRYFCGEKEPFTNNLFDGLENYGFISEKVSRERKGRLYSKSELDELLQMAGFESNRYYSCIPSLSRPEILLAHDYFPNEVIDVRVFPQYRNPETIFLNEKYLYDTLMKEGIFHKMANGYFIECSKDGKHILADQITLQEDRPREEAMITIIEKDVKVIKMPLYKEGDAKLSKLMENAEYLRQHGVPMAPMMLENGQVITPYIKGELATEYFRRLMKTNLSLFKKELQNFKQIIEKSSDHLSYDEVQWEKFDAGWEERKADDPNLYKWRDMAFGSEKEKTRIGTVLKRGYIDLVSLNCFHNENGFIFFDQEFFVEEVTVNAILIRTIDLIYGDTMEYRSIFSKEDLLKELNLLDNQDFWRNQCNVFLGKLLQQKELATYHQKVRAGWNTVHDNRFRMSYSKEKFDRLFHGLFKGIYNKDVYLFGSGKFATRFLEDWGKDVTIKGILDNNAGKQGECLNGIPIISPECIIKRTKPYKVIICVKDFEPILTQLEHLGVEDMVVYSPTMDYERPAKIQVSSQSEETTKKYHIGYVAGVFDLFHIGHLNLLRRAKEQCDYLIVGVVTDEQVMQGKRTNPRIPFEDRKSIVEACKYVDEAIRIPPERPDTEDAWRKYHFDAQFSGDDYIDNPYWLAKKEFLNQHGSDLVFFPYTKSVSSTRLKKEIDNLSV